MRNRTPTQERPSPWIWIAVAACMAGALPSASAAPGAETAPDPPPAREVGASNQLASRLAASGRGEARFVREAEDPFGGEPLRHPGTLALEPPDRVLLRFPTTGEQLALRGDQGEWLQPELEQMLVLGPDHLAIARLWWGVLLGTGHASVETVPLGARRFRLVTYDQGQAVDSASVWLDRDGLPARLDFRDDNGTEVRYRFDTWRFSKARGTKAFMLSAPKGFETVRLP